MEIILKIRSSDVDRLLTFRNERLKKTHFLPFSQNKSKRNGGSISAVLPLTTPHIYYECINFIVCFPMNIFRLIVISFFLAVAIFVLCTHTNFVLKVNIIVIKPTNCLENVVYDSKLVLNKINLKPLQPLAVS